jgi:hypothetical protein
MNKFRFSMLLAAALTIVTLALPVSAASTPNPDNGSPVGITAPQTPAPSTDNEQVETEAPPPCDGDFIAPEPLAPPPCDGDFTAPEPLAPPPCDGD